jgi:hypothetical protein
MKTLRSITALFILLSGTISFAGELSVEATIQHPSCFNKKDGAVSLSISGGKGEITIIWQDGISSTYRDQLGNGVYTYTVRDSKGESVEGKAELKSNGPLTISFGQKTDIRINGTKVLGDIHISGGTPFSDPEMYMVRLDQEIIHERSDINSNQIYNLSIQDASGCALNFPVMIQKIVGNENDNCEKEKSTLPLMTLHFPKLPTSNSMSLVTTSLVSTMQPE